MWQPKIIKETKWKLFIHKQCFLLGEMSHTSCIYTLPPVLTGLLVLQLCHKANEKYSGHALSLALFPLPLLSALQGLHFLRLQCQTWGMHVCTAFQVLYFFIGVLKHLNVSFNPNKYLLSLSTVRNHKDQALRWTAKQKHTCWTTLSIHWYHRRCTFQVLFIWWTC